MYKLINGLILAIIMLSCSAEKAVTKMNDGFYVAKFNKDLIFSYTILITIKDSTAILDAFVEEKGMIMAYNIFTNEPMLPKSEHFRLQKADKCYILSNSYKEIILGVKGDEVMIEDPLKLKLKYYKEVSNRIYPSRKYALYCYCWFYPHVILGLTGLENACKSYIQKEMELNLKNEDEDLTYEDYFSIIKNSISQYKQNFEIESKK